MVSINLPGMSGWGNPYSRLPGALGLSPFPGEGGGAFFFLGNGLLTLAARTFTSTAFDSPGATITEVFGIHDDGVVVFHSTTPSLTCRWGDDSALTLDPHQAPCAWGAHEPVYAALTWGNRFVRSGLQAPDP